MGVAIGLPLFRPRIVSSEKLPTFMPRRNKDEIMALLMRTKALTRYCFAIRYVLLFAWCLSIGSVRALKEMVGRVSDPSKISFPASAQEFVDVFCISGKQMAHRPVRT